MVQEILTSQHPPHCSHLSLHSIHHHKERISCVGLSCSLGFFSVEIDIQCMQSLLSKEKKREEYSKTGKKPFIQ